MDQQQISHLLPLYFGFIAVFMLIGAIVVLIPYWQIFKKAGFPPPLALLMVVPLANIIVLYVVAFSQWKVVPVAPTYPPAMPPAYPPPPSYPQTPPQV
jgi:membrane-associated protease RseP (regulator of RpoE activity)